LVRWDTWRTCQKGSVHTQENIRTCTKKNAFYDVPSLSCILAFTFSIVSLAST
jgi:hypothetical protein